MIILIMGVSGTGKTTVGRLLAEQLGWKYFDADNYHPSANVEKMRAGIPLEDADRVPWLETLRDLIRGCLGRGESAVLACSALKACYRDYLLVDGRVVMVYLKAGPEVIQSRLARRRGHFMNPSLLESQFDTLEEPPPATHLDASSSPEEIVKNIRSRLGL